MKQYKRIIRDKTSTLKNYLIGVLSEAKANHLQNSSVVTTDVCNVKCKTDCRPDCPFKCC